MEEFKKRLNQEHEELRDKIGKLESFVNSKKIHEVTNIQRSLLIIQLDAMNTYASILYERLGNL